MPKGHIGNIPQMTNFWWCGISKIADLNAAKPYHKTYGCKEADGQGFATMSLTAELGDVVRRGVLGASEDFVAEAIRHDLARGDQRDAIQETSGHGVVGMIFLIPSKVWSSCSYANCQSTRNRTPNDPGHGGYGGTYLK